MQNKANFGNDKMNITLDMTSIYEILSAGSGQKTNPIQSQFKPKQTQFKPKQTQFKPNFKSRMLVDLVDLREAIDRMVKVYSREALLGKVIL